MNTAITNVRAVLADRVTDPITVVVEDGLIADLKTAPAPRDSIAGHGALLLPGLIDTHSDGLEKEVSPRRAVRFPLEYGLLSFEGRVRAAGVTTVCHGVGYQEKPDAGRTVKHAREVVAAIAARRQEPTAAVEHQVLYRFEARDQRALDPLLADLDQNRSSGGTPPLLSFEDHTPGQGQYRDISQFEAAVNPELLQPGQTIKEYVADLIEKAEAASEVSDTNRGQIAPLARAGAVQLLAHDLETLEDVDRAIESGASIAEFPLNIEVATKARGSGMAIVMGAPNALRGCSHAGNISARELVAAGLCDVIASDYMPSAMLASAFAMAADRTCSLPEAVGLVTSGPAALVGGASAGRIEVGAAADLVLVDDRGPWPMVLAVHRAADHPMLAGISR